MNKKMYGIVEGFFSDPLPAWTYKERNDTIDYITKYAGKINTYLFCPKNDVYIKQDWDLLYSKKDIAKLERLIDKCNKNNISFYYGLNPSVNKNTNWQKLEKKVMKKLNQILNIGCKNICLLFDDIPVAYDVADQIEREDNVYSKIVDLVNSVYKKIRLRTNDFWFCSPDYCFKEKSPVTETLKILNKEIGVIWTGNEIFSKIITTGDIKRVKSLLFKELRLIYWSNYPVNDCEQAVNSFNLGGFYPIKKSVLNQLAGILVNPMRECFSNLPFYITFSDFLSKPDSYLRLNNWNNALKQNDLSKDDAAIINEFSSSNFIDEKKYQRIIASQNSTAIQKTFRQIPNNWDNANKNKWNRYFLQAIQSILQDAMTLRNIWEKIRSSQNISPDLLAKWDWFPTKTNIVRYLPEIIAIIKAKYSTYGTKYVFSAEGELVNYFNKTYLGANRLKITPSDTKMFSKAITATVKKERKLFLGFVNKTSVPAIDKIKLFVKRKNVNRFTYNRTYTATSCAFVSSK